MSTVAKRMLVVCDKCGRTADHVVVLCSHCGSSRLQEKKRTAMEVKKRSITTFSSAGATGVIVIRGS